MKQSARKEKKEGLNKKDGKGDEEEQAAEENTGIHPARLAMMQNIDRPTHRQRY
jgi:hypothetical protein